MLYLLKVLVSALVIVGVTELSRRGGSFWGGLLVSLPLTSLLAFLWLWGETHDAQKISALSWNIFWLVLPSLSLFIALPLLLKRMAFPLALPLSMLVMIVCYLVAAALLRRFGLMI